MLLSCIIPCYDEAENIRPFFQAAEQALAPWDRQYELIFVDDGSRDETLQELEKLYRRAPDRVRVVSFSRNFGKEAAIYAGLHHCAGDYVALIDADLQQRPDYIAQMLTFLEEHPEYDEVVAYQERRNESRLLVLCKGLFYKIIRRLTGLPFAADASDFRVFRRNVLEAILSLPERGRFSKGIFAWIGFPTYRMPYQVEERANGASKWSLGKLFGLRHGGDHRLLHQTAAAPPDCRGDSGGGRGAAGGGAEDSVRGWRTLRHRCGLAGDAAGVSGRGAAPGAGRRRLLPGEAVQRGQGAACVHRAGSAPGRR